MEGDGPLEGGNRGKITALAGTGQFVLSGIETHDVAIMMLVVVQLHGLLVDVGLQCGVIVR